MARSRRRRVAALFGLGTLLVLPGAAESGLIVESFVLGSVTVADGLDVVDPGSGPELVVTSTEAFAAGSHQGTVGVDGGLELGRRGLAAPSATPWVDLAQPNRRCFVIDPATLPAATPAADGDTGGAAADPDATGEAANEAAAGDGDSTGDGATEPPPEADLDERPTPTPVELRLDTAAEIAAGRMAVDGGSVRAHLGTGVAVPHWRPDGVGGVDTTVWVELPDTPTSESPEDERTICLSWGAADLTDVSAPIELPTLADGRLARTTWTGLNPTALRSIDWTSAPSDIGTVTSSARSDAACDRCAVELLGTWTPNSDGPVVLALSGSAPATLEISSTGAAADLQPIVVLDTATPPQDWTDARQHSAAFDVVGGQPVLIRVRQRDDGSAVTDPEAGPTAEHLAVAVARPDTDGLVSELRLLEPEKLADTDGVAGGWTERRWLDVPTATVGVRDRTVGPNETVVVDAATVASDLCTWCETRLEGWFTPTETGTHVLAAPGQADVALVVALDGEPASAVEADPTGTTVDLVAGTPIWLRATVRGDDTGPLLAVTVQAPSEEQPGVLPATTLSSFRPEIDTTLTATGGPVEGLRGTTGTWISPVYDLADDAGRYGVVRVAATRPEGTDVAVRIGTSSSPDGPFVFTGPAAGLAHGPGSGIASAVHDGQRYLRLQIELTNTGDPDRTPSLTEVGVRTDIDTIGLGLGQQTEIRVTTADDGSVDRMILELDDLPSLDLGAELRLVDAVGGGAASDVEFALGGATGTLRIDDGVVVAAATGLAPVAEGGSSTVTLTARVDAAMTVDLEWIGTDDAGGFTILHDLRVVIDRPAP